MAIVALEGMRFFGYHGVFAEEQQNGNHFQVDVWLDTGDVALPQRDDLAEVTDYGQAYAVVAEVMEHRADLLETLLRRIGEGLLAIFPNLAHVRVRVSKFDPPVGGACHRSYVEAEFRP